MVELVDEETCPSCGRNLTSETVESIELIRWVVDPPSNVLVQMFCSEEHLAEWLLAKLKPVERARVLDDYLPRATGDARTPLWYNKG